MTVNGAVANKPSRQVHPGDAILVLGPPPRFVGRGGEKLDGALSGFAVDPRGWRAVDVGASTGGFTDCLLQHGCAEVAAIDVGHGQLHPRLRADPRVIVHERLHVRSLNTGHTGGRVDLAVADLSFISLRHAIAPILGVLRPQGLLILLVKPQFEAGRAEVARGGGVITDPTIHARVCDELDAALTQAGCTVIGWMPSPLLGGDGNREFFVAASATLEEEGR